MNIYERYVVYKLNKVADSSKHLALEELRFGKWGITNAFHTEKEAIEALVEDAQHYEDFVILKQVHLQLE